jgi:hypothetical protein
MICILVLRNGKVIQGSTTITTYQGDPLLEIVFNVKTKNNLYSIRMSECRKVVFKHANNK